MPEKPPKLYTSYQIIKAKGKYKIKNKYLSGFIKNNNFLWRTDLVFDTVEEAKEYIYSLEKGEDYEEFEVVKEIEIEE